MLPEDKLILLEEILSHILLHETDEYMLHCAKLAWREFLGDGMNPSDDNQMQLPF